MSHIVAGVPLANTVGRSEALAIATSSIGPFGSGQAGDLDRVVEWFVSEGAELELEAQPGNGGALHGGVPCYCNGGAVQFSGMLRMSKSRAPIARVAIDVDLDPGFPRLHLEWWERTGNLPLRPHLARLHRAAVRRGLQELRLEAGLQSGPTYWARAGVDFAAGQPQLEAVRAAVAHFTGTVAAALPPLGSPSDCLGLDGVATIREAYWAIARVPGGATFLAHPSQLAFKDQVLGIDIDAPLPIGEAVLFAMGPWNGVVDLRSPGQSDHRFAQWLL